MPESQQPAEGQKIMTEMILAGSPKTVIDVGAGDGKWGRLLEGRVDHIVALEICPAYVKKYGLHEIYDAVIVGNATEFNGWGNFDVVILGDVLEHLTRQDGLALIDKLKRTGSKVFLTIPISPCEQDGTVYGNPYESHLDQWTDEELTEIGWEQLHRGLNPNGKVLIGTYRLVSRT